MGNRHILSANIIRNIICPTTNNDFLNTWSTNSVKCHNIMVKCHNLKVNFLAKS